MTPSGIEPATFWFVAQYINHCATLPYHMFSHKCQQSLQILIPIQLFFFGIYDQNASFPLKNTITSSIIKCFEKFQIHDIESIKNFPYFPVCHNCCHSWQLLCHCMWNTSNKRCVTNRIVSWYLRRKVWRTVLPLSNSPWVCHTCCAHLCNNC
jgi:hypothetical protein